MFFKGASHDHESFQDGCIISISKNLGTATNPRIPQAFINFTRSCQIQHPGKWVHQQNKEERGERISLSKAAPTKNPIKLPINTHHGPTREEKVSHPTDPFWGEPPGRCSAMILCWLLGNGCPFSFNSMFTTKDYYVFLYLPSTGTVISYA
ncbi:uncharacterized protein [Elaeis guineensis]|uniref:Uncharacterized protein LOC105032062 isoform X5 n=1 Tax=Elaeis guineensis var. tenera TaxID=51953 RepID=A0A8N4EPP1_ELAGV|nr:uncharacterized protein LOC105032062 isoform X5 [Elaeis guineensis]